MILLDTHVLHWLDVDDQRLGDGSRRLASEALERDDCAVSSASFWELALLVARGRIDLGATVAAWRADVLRTGLIELALDGTAAIRAVTLDLPHKDPADRFIVATALLHDATLLTADETLLAWRGPLRRRDARA